MIALPTAHSGEPLATAVEEARAQARLSNRRVVEVLEDNLKLPPAAFTAAVAGWLRFPVVSSQRLHELTPAFDVLPFGEALARECIALRDERGALSLVIGDPFALDLQAWACERLEMPFEMALSHRDEISACLARVEGNMRAMDGVMSGDEGGAGLWEHVEDLSLKSIGENASPVVRLVNSTLY
ncbi:MAG TPA: type II/IV secretion system protein, partial [Burkholderiales bacterium]